MSLEDAYPEDTGRIRFITGTDPAAGAEISETVPTNAIWELISMRFSMACSADVANRYVGISFDNGTTSYFIQDSNYTAAATYTPSYCASQVQIRSGEAVVSGHIPIPIKNRLKAGYRIRTATTGLQAADNFGAPSFVVREWLVRQS